MSDWTVRKKKSFNKEKILSFPLSLYQRERERENIYIYIQPWSNSECDSRKRNKWLLFNSFPSVIFRSFDNSPFLKKERIWRKHESDEGVKKQSWTKDWKASGAAFIHRLKSYSQLSHVRIARASTLHRRVFCTPTRTCRNLHSEVKKRNSPEYGNRESQKDSHRSMENFVKWTCPCQWICEQLVFILPLPQKLRISVQVPGKCLPPPL